MPNLLSASNPASFGTSSFSGPMSGSTPQLPKIGSKPLSMANLGIGMTNGQPNSIGSGSTFNTLSNSLGVRAASPTANIQSPSNTLPASKTAPNSQQPGAGSSGGNLPSLLSTSNPTQNQALVTPGGGTNATQTNTPASYASLLANAGANSPAPGYTQQLAQTGTQLQPLVQPAIQTANSDLQKAQQAALASETLETTGGPSAPLLGNALAQQQLGQNFQNLATAAGGLATSGVTGQQTGLNQAAGLAQTQQNLAQQGYQAAGQLTQPSSQYSQIAPGSSAINSQGQQVYSGLGSLEQYQAEQISNAQRGTYGAQSQAISTGLNSLNNTFANVQAIAQQYGINPTQYPSANSLISAMQAQVTTPGGQAAFTEAMNALKTQMAQQVQTFASSGALTPSVSSSFISSLNSSNLSPTELGQLYDAVTATGLANLQASASSFNQSNTATQNATLPSSFGSTQAPQSTYNPPANISGGNTVTDLEGNSYQLVQDPTTGLWESKPVTQ